MKNFMEWFKSETLKSDVDFLKEDNGVETPRDFKKGQKYEKFVKNLMKNVSDEKAKKWIDYVFGGGKDDIQFNVQSESAVPVKNLFPTQNFIGLENSIGFVVNHPDMAADSLKKMLIDSSPTIKAGSPVWIFEGKYIIDGHHRWSQVYAFNPEAKIVAINFTSKKKIEPKQALAAVQGVIASVTGKVPVSTSKVDGKNIKASNVLNDNESTMLKAAQLCLDSSAKKGEFEELCKDIVSKDKERKISGIMSGFKNNDSDGAKVLTYAVRNCLSLKKNNQSISGAPDREFMPQTDGGQGASKSTPDEVKGKLKSGVGDEVTKVESVEYDELKEKINESIL